MAIEWRIVITEGEKYRDPIDKKVRAWLCLLLNMKIFQRPKKNYFEGKLKSFEQASTFSVIRCSEAATGGVL